MQNWNEKIKFKLINHTIIQCNFVNVHTLYNMQQFFVQMKEHLSDIWARYKAIREREKLLSAVNSLLTARHDFTAFYEKGFNWQAIAINFGVSYGDKNDRLILLSRKARERPFGRFYDNAVSLVNSSIPRVNCTWIV